MGVIVRLAVADDCSAIQQLIAQLGYTATEVAVRTRLRHVEESGQQALVAERDGKVIGCLTTSTMVVLHRPAPVGRSTARAHSRSRCPS